MARKQVQQVDILVTQTSVDSAAALTKKFADQGKRVDDLLKSLQLVEKQLKAIKAVQIDRTPNFMKGAVAGQETQVQKAAISADSKRIQAYKDLLKLDQERAALLLSQNKALDDTSRRLRRITDLEQLQLSLQAAQYRAKEAQLQQDTKAQRAAERLVERFKTRIDQVNAEAKAREAAIKRERDALAAMDRMAAQIDAGRAQREKKRETEALGAMARIQNEIKRGQDEREKAEDALARKQKKHYEERIRQLQREYDAQLKIMMQPHTNRANAERSRQMSELRLFGDGGASLLRIQASLMANYMLVNRVTSAFSNAVSAAYEFDRSLRDLQAVVRITDGGMQGLKQTIIDASDASRFTANEVARAAMVLGQAGFSNTQIRESVSAVAQLATATGTDLSKAVDVATSVIGIFNLEASRMQEVANTLTQAINSSKLDIEKLTLGLQYAGNTAYDAGVSFEELTAGLGAMANAGIRSGSTLGTGMRQILVSLEKPSENFQKNLYKLGLTTYDVDLKTKGLYQVMKTLREAGFSASDAIESFEVRSASAFIALSNNLPLMETMQQSFYGSVAATQAQETQMRSLAGQAERLNGVLSSLAYQAFEPMLYFLRDTAKAVSDFLITLRGSEGTLQTFGTVLATSVGGVIAYASLNRLLGLLGLLPSKALLASTAMVQLGSSMNRSLAVGTVAMSTNTLVASLQNLMITIRSMPALFAIASTAMGSFNGVLAVARVGVVAFGAAIVSWLPVIAGIGLAVYSTVQAFSSYETEQQRATNSVDMWRTRLDASKGAVESYKAKLKEVEDRIQSLSNRSKELNRNQNLLKNEINQVRSQFAGMSSTIDGTESNVDQLIAKLQALWAQLQQEYILKIGVQISNLSGLMTALNLQGLDISNRMSAAQYSDTSGDAELEAAYKAVVAAQGTPAFNEARAQFDNVVNRRIEELATGSYITPPSNDPEGPVYSDPLSAGVGEVDADLARRQFLEESIARSNVLNGLVQEAGNLEAQKLDVQSQMSTAELDQQDAVARSRLTREEAQRMTIENQIREGLAQIEKTYADDPIARFEATQNLADTYLPMIEGAEASIKNRSDLTANVVNEQLGKWNELRGSLTGGVADAFTDYDKEQNSIEDRTARTSNLVYQGVLEKARRAGTVADAKAGYSEAEYQSQRLLEQDLAAIDTSLRRDSQGNLIETTESRAARFDAQERFDERMRDISRERENTVQGIESGMGGQVAIARASFDRAMDDLRTSDANIKNKYDNAELNKQTAAENLQANAASAQKMLDLLTTERQNLEAKGSLTSEEQARFRYLAGAENTLRDYIRGQESDINNLLNDPEVGAETAAGREFSTALSNLQTKVEETRIDAKLGKIDEKEAVNRYTAVQNEANAQLTTVQTKLEPIQRKVDANIPLTPQEERDYAILARQERSLRSFMADNLSNVEGSSGGGTGSGSGSADAGASRDFNLLMDEMKTSITDAEQNLKYGDMTPQEAVDQMDATLAKAKEELETRRQQMATMTEGSAEYNRLKSEERTLLGFIREEEEAIRKTKEEQGLVQFNLNKLLTDYATQNLNMAQGFADGFAGVLSSIQGGFETFFTDLITGTKSAKEAFRDFAGSVVQSIAQMISKMIAMWIMQKLIGMVTGGGAPEGSFAFAMRSAVGLSNMTGGVVRKATGGQVVGNLARDSKLYSLMPDEYVLRASAAKAIGYDTLDQLNAMGNNKMASGGHYGVASQSKGPFGQTNVYVVAPEQQPVPGPSDIIAVINDDIARNGTTKKLIKSVAMGY